MVASSNFPREPLRDRTAAINAATLALLDAGIAVKDIPVACAVSYVQKTALLGEYCRLPSPISCVPTQRCPPLADPNHTELLGGGAEIVTCVLPRSGKLAVTVMDDRLPVDAFQVGCPCTQVYYVCHTGASDSSAERDGACSGGVCAPVRHHDRRCQGARAAAAHHTRTDDPALRFKQALKLQLNYYCTVLFPFKFLIGHRTT